MQLGEEGGGGAGGAGIPDLPLRADGELARERVAGIPQLPPEIAIAYVTRKFDV